jgi:outer membrane murein-binding lipoprotein Lpp
MLNSRRRSQTKKAKTPEQQELEDLRAKMAALEKENKGQQAQIQAAKKSGKSGNVEITKLLCGQNPHEQRP